MVKKARETPSTTRLQSIIDLDTAARMDAARASLKRAGVFVSSSMFVEIALRELLTHGDRLEDLIKIMRANNATARREKARPQR